MTCGLQMIPGLFFASFANIQFLQAFLTAPRTSVTSSPFPVNSSFTTDMLENIEVPNRVPRLRIADCGGAHSLHWEPCGLPWFWVTSCFCSRYGFTGVFPAKSPCNLGCLHIFETPIPREERINNVFLNTPSHGAAVSDSLEEPAGARLGVEHSSSTRFLWSLPAIQE